MTARVLIPLIAASLLASAPAAFAWEPDVDGAIRTAERRAGKVSFAVRTPDERWGWRARRSVPAASVLKAMLLVAYLNDPRVRDRDLRPRDRRLLAPMVRRSDNATATSVLVYVGRRGMERLARRAGMRRFELETGIWGNSRIDAADQARFFLSIDRRIVPRHRAYAMRLLRTITPSQRWGIGLIPLPGWTKHFKSGWGSATGAVEHQVMLLQRDTERVAIAVMITNSPSHAYAKRTLRLVLARLTRGL